MSTTAALTRTSPTGPSQPQANGLQPPPGFCTRQIELSGGQKAFPNIAEMVKASKKTTAHPSVVDVIQFFPGVKPTITPNLKVPDLRSTVQEHAPATIFIVEQVDEAFMNCLSGHCRKNADGDLSQFLEDYLQSPPWYNYNDIALQLPHRTPRDMPHIMFEFVGAREFDVVHSDPLTKDRVETPEDSWWDVYERKAGGIKPIQRNEPDGRITDFKPIALVRYHLAAWFDVDSKGTWKTGVILVDPPFKVADPESSLKKPALKPLFNNNLDAVDFHKKMVDNAYDSHRPILRDLLEANPHLKKDVPSPLQILHEAYRLIATESLCATMYFTRDINNTEWLLESINENQRETAILLEKALECLFTVRRRVARYKILVNSYLASCALLRESSWAKERGSSTGPSPISVEVTGEIKRGLQQSMDLITHTIERTDQGIQLLTNLLSIFDSKLSLRHTQYAAYQNKTLLVLTTLATFFLPINTISAILNMQGDWAPVGEGSFPLFWGIAIPISAVLVFIILFPRIYHYIRSRL